MRMVIDADRQNKNLLIISDAIVKSSFINTLSSPPIVSKLEEELREAFNEIISNLRQYFIDVDDKLKRIG